MTVAHSVCLLGRRCSAAAAAAATAAAATAAAASCRQEAAETTEKKTVKHSVATRSLQVCSTCSGATVSIPEACVGWTAAAREPADGDWGIAASAMDGKAHATLFLQTEEQGAWGEPQHLELAGTEEGPGQLAEAAVGGSPKADGLTPHDCSQDLGTHGCPSHCWAHGCGTHG